MSYGSEEVLPGLLDSIPGATADPVLVIVADNNPASGGAAGQARSAGALYVPLPANRGYGAAVNAALAHIPSSVDWILICNPDVVLEPRSVDRLVSLGESDPTIGAVGPKILTEEGQVYPSARALPSLRVGIGHALFSTFWEENPWTRAYRRGDDNLEGRRDAGWLSGACVVVRRSAFEYLGGFDEEYFMYFEDVDLGWRLGKAGYRNVFEPAAVVRHSGAHSTTSDAARMVRAHHASAKRFLGKMYPGLSLLPVRTLVRIGLTARASLLTRQLDP